MDTPTYTRWHDALNRPVRYLFDNSTRAHISKSTDQALIVLRSPWSRFWLHQRNTPCTPRVRRRVRRFLKKKRPKPSPSTFPHVYISSITVISSLSLRFILGELTFTGVSFRIVRITGGGRGVGSIGRDWATLTKLSQRGAILIAQLSLLLLFLLAHERDEIVSRNDRALKRRHDDGWSREGMDSPRSNPREGLHASYDGTE